MRRLLFIIGLPCLLSATAVSAADLQAQQSVHDLECKYAGDCGSADADADGPRQPKGATKGFSLSRPGAMTSAAVPQPVAAARPSPSVQRIRTGAARPAPHRAAGVSHGDLMIGFASNSATITPQGLANLRAFAQALNGPKLAPMRFKISGHTSAVGTRESNLALSNRRAAAVADYLVGQGVGRDRLQVEGVGFDQPLPGQQPQAAINRRVEAERIAAGSAGL